VLSSKVLEGNSSEVFLDCGNTPDILVGIYMSTDRKLPVG